MNSANVCFWGGDPDADVVVVVVIDVVVAVAAVDGAASVGNRSVVTSSLTTPSSPLLIDCRIFVIDLNDSH